MDKIIWARKRLRLFLYLAKNPERNDLIAFATLAALTESFGHLARPGDYSLLRACNFIGEFFETEVSEEKKKFSEKLRQELTQTHSVQLY